MGPKRIAAAYLAMIALVAIALDQGSLPEELGMSYTELFVYFFVVITAAFVLSQYVKVVYRRVSERDDLK